MTCVYGITCKTLSCHYSLVLFGNLTEEEGKKVSGMYGM